MPNTYDPIATYTFSSSGTSYTFSSIPGTYTDLILIASVKAGTNPGYGVSLRFNSDTGNNYNYTYFYGTGSAVYGSTRTSQSSLVFSYGTGVGTGTPSLFESSIMNYASTNVNKNFLCRAANFDSTYGGGEYLSGTWANTSAITSIEVVNLFGSMTFATGSTLTLYGVAAA